MTNIFAGLRFTLPFCVKIRKESWLCEGNWLFLRTEFVKRLKKKEIMSTVTIKDVSMSPLEALWTLFKSQPKSVRRAFTQKLIQEEVDAEAIRNKLVVKQSLTQAFKELADAERSGSELPNARNLFK